MKSGFFRNIDYRILLISDSHGKNSNIRNAVNKSGPFDMILHAGDLESDPKPLAEALGCPCYFVKGNCDYNPELPAFQVIDLGEHKVFLTHGHRYFVNGGTAKLEYAALEQGCDIAVYGHTHVPAMIKRDDITVVNPGSVSLPRQSPRRKTFMIMEIYKDGTVDFNLVEM